MKKMHQFIVLTYFVSWVTAGLSILLGLRINNLPLYTIFAMAYMLLPAICAIILQVIHKEKPLRNLNISFRLNWWFLVAVITPIVYAFLTLAVNLLFPSVSFSFGEGFLASLPAEQAEIATQQLSQFHPAVLLLIQVGSALIAGCTINAFFALGEELGWRGYLLKEMKNQKLIKASVVIGVVWGLWHFPLILLGHNYPEHSVIGVGMMVIWCILLSPVMTYITVKAKSVIAAAIFHGLLNAIASKRPGFRQSPRTCTRTRAAATR